jgi:hypothetical protein
MRAAARVLRRVGFDICWQERDLVICTLSDGGELLSLELAERTGFLEKTKAYFETRHRSETAAVERCYEVVGGEPADLSLPPSVVGPPE